MIQWTNRNKTIALGVLGVLLAYLVYTNVLSGPSSEPASAPAKPAAGASAASPAMPDTDEAATSSRVAASTARKEWHPVLRAKRKELRVSMSGADPTIRTDLLRKVQDEALAGGSRNLFGFGTAPPPPTPKVNPLTGQEAKIGLNGPGGRGPGGPPPPQPITPPNTDPPPVPMTLRYYGFFQERANGRKTAFFLDGDDIVTASEGQTLKKRFKVVRIGANSVLVQDTESQRVQTVPITPQEVSG